MEQENDQATILLTKLNKECSKRAEEATILSAEQSKEMHHVVELKAALTEHMNVLNVDLATEQKEQMAELRTEVRVVNGERMLIV